MMRNDDQRLAELSQEQRGLLEAYLLKKIHHSEKIQEIPRRQVFSPCPLSFAQQRLWFLDQLEPGRHHYHITRTIRLSGALDVYALQEALNTIVERHESLRTTFIAEQGIPKQVIWEHRSVDLSVIELGGTPTTTQEAELRQLLQTEVRKPFTLSSDLMLRALLLRLHKDEHVLLLRMHHIASDGWSMGVLWRELSILYTALCTGQPSSLPELPVQYADFAVWQREWLQGDVLQRQLAYWERQLENLPILQVPTDRPHPVIQTFRGAHYHCQLSKSLSERLNTLSLQTETTLFMTLLAAFNVLLHRYTGQDDIVVGSPIANRNRAEIEGLIGFFVNSLVLRTRLSGNLTFRELLAQVREVTLQAYTHQDLPFEKLVEELQPTRDLSRNPLFQVLFVLQNAPIAPQRLAGLILTPLPFATHTVRFDLECHLRETLEGLSAHIIYNIDLFNAMTIERLAGHFQTLLEGIVADPDQHLSEIPLLTANERHQILVAWNNTWTEYPRLQCLHQLFEAQVQRTPDTAAVVFENQHLTYRELNGRANRLAHYLTQFGVGPDVCVGICVERSFDMAVGVLGILKAGGVYVPLDPVYPEERLAFMLSDSHIFILVIQAVYVEKFPDFPGTMVDLNRDWIDIAQQHDENPGHDVALDNLAYVIYTSGSTGTPKGVAMPRRALANLIAWQLENTIVPENASTLQFASLSFDVSFQELFSTWGSGGTVVLISEERRRDPLALLRVLEAHAIQRLFLPFVALQQLADAAERSGFFPRALQEVLTAGEQLQTTPALVSLFTHLKAGRLTNQYGPSESHVVTASVLPNDSNKWAALPPIGTPIANSRVYILDTQFQPTPIGVVGELYIGGRCLARGYHHRPELTAERFIPDPFSHKPDARLYKTGDLARYLSDGAIEFLGRRDHQVKIRGFRVELGEIEAVLRHHSTVRESVVVVREDEPGYKRLIAYIVPTQETSSLPEELRSFLTKKFPDYMIPSIFVLLEVLPLTPNGKIDRQALPVPEEDRPAFGEAFLPPQDALELQLTQIWKQILGVHPISIRDNFFELGGHSLLAIRLIAQIERLTGRTLPLATLFQAPTIQQFAAILRQDGWSSLWSTLVPIQPRGTRPPLFYVPAGATTLFGAVAVALYKYLGPEQPLYGLQPRGVDWDETPYISVEKMATHYIREIRQFQPTGPYFLAGRCFGGVVVFEMAQQLRAQGQEVALLAVLEALHPPGFHYTQQGYVIRPGYTPLQRLVQRFVFYRYWYQKRMLLKYFKDVWRARFGSKQPADNPQNLSSSIHERRLQRLREAQNKARVEYVPTVYPGKIVCFSSEETFDEGEDPRTGWKYLTTEELEVHFVPGDHRSMEKEPHVRVFVEKLKICLEKAQDSIKRE